MNHDYARTILDYVDTLNAQFEYRFQCHPDIYPVIIANQATPLVFIYQCIYEHVSLTSFYNANLDEAFWWGFCEVFPHRVDWKQLCSNTNLSSKFWHYQCKMHPSRIDWSKLCTNPSLDDSFWLVEIRQLQDWSSLHKSRHLSSTFWDYVVTVYPDHVDWDVLSETVHDLWFIEKHLSEISWRDLVWNSGCTLSFWCKQCEERGDQIDWKELCRLEKLPSSFWERFEAKHGHKWSWSRLSSNSGLSASFWETRLDKVNWTKLAFNSQLNADFWTRHIQHADLYRLCQTDHLPMSFWEEQCRVRPHALTWYFLMFNTELDCTFWEYQVEHNSRHINWNFLSSCDLPLSFWKKKKRMDRLNWCKYAFHAQLEPHEWVEHAHLINVNDVVWNTSTPVEFWEKCDLSGILSVFRRSFMRDREFPLSFWLKHVDTYHDADFYRNVHSVKQLVKHQLEQFLMLK